MSTCTQKWKSALCKKPSNSVTKSPSTELPSDELPSDEELELKFLRWFYQEADFGPAHDDVILIMMENYHAADPKNIIPYSCFPDYIEGFIDDDAQ